MKKIIRVFPRKTNATPIDENVRFGDPGLFDTADEIHVSVAFSWDLRNADELADLWSIVAPVKVGGPATNKCKGEFTPGMYLKKGYTITSRGCPNRCWFCDVWKKFGNVTELKIRDGWNLQDDNLLACSDQHIKAVFKMLERQKHLIIFSGGLEAKRLKPWHIDLLLKLKLKQIFFAYDAPNDLEPLICVSRLLKRAGIIKPTSNAARCYVLIGYPNDAINKAEERLKTVIRLGFMPMAMLYRDYSGKRSMEWKKIQREWANPIIVGSKMANQ